MRTPCTPPLDPPLARYLSKSTNRVSYLHSLLRNIYVADSGSGSVKMINRSIDLCRVSVVDFLSNLHALLVAFIIYSKGKSEMGLHPTVGEAIEMVNQTFQIDNNNNNNFFRTHKPKSRCFLQIMWRYFLYHMIYIIEQLSSVIKNEDHK